MAPPYAVSGPEREPDAEKTLRCVSSGSIGSQNGISAPCIAYRITARPYGNQYRVSNDHAVCQYCVSYDQTIWHATIRKVSTGNRTTMRYVSTGDRVAPAPPQAKSMDPKASAVLMEGWEQQRRRQCRTPRAQSVACQPGCCPAYSSVSHRAEN
eukprot:35166-Rhodomonas_salina.5